MTWGIQVEDPKTLKEARERAKMLKEKFYAPSRGDYPKLSREQAYHIRRKMTELHTREKWQAYVRACEEKQRQDQAETIKRLQEEAAVRELWFSMASGNGEKTKRSRNLPAHLYFRRIVQWVAKRYGFTEDDLYGKRRSKSIIAARHLAIQIIGHSRRLVCYSLPEIGKRFNRDHTSILHALNKAPSYRNRRPIGQNTYFNRLRDFDRMKAERMLQNAQS